MNPVNQTSPPSYRQQQAQATRDRVAAAARRLFAERGYAATSVEAIAREAGVAVRTVYAAFGNKTAILGAVCSAWLAESDIQPLVGLALLEPDPHRQLALAAQWTRQQYERGTDVIAIFEGAARDDAEMAGVVGGWLAQKNALMSRFVGSLERALAPGLGTPDATALFLALTGFEVYRQLALEAGWPPDRYQAWLTGTLRHQLLDPALSNEPSPRTNETPAADEGAPG